MNNPLPQEEVQGQFQALNGSQLERGLVRPLGEGSKGGNPLGVEEEWNMHITMIPLRMMELLILPPL